MTQKDFLLEIGCEELPAKGLNNLALQLGEQVTQLLTQAKLGYADCHTFATPRRLAVIVKNLQTEQPPQQIEKRGPALSAPQAAKEGFARSAGIRAEELVSENGYWIHRYQSEAKATIDLLPELISKALSKLNIPKPMRWGSADITFLRPVRWVVILYGDTLIQTEILNKKTVAYTYGHRFHHPGKLLLLNASVYPELLLEEGFVYPDFLQRRQIIKEQIQKLAIQHGGKALIDDALLDEVTGLVEWPVAILCQFSPAFLKVPKEALISSMQHHQKSFAVVDKSENLLPFFIAISNIQSQQPEKVIAGNQRVMRARLADAAFFYEQDLKQTLEHRFEILTNITFQQKLGSIADKVQRIMQLSTWIAKHIHANVDDCKRAAQLCKSDLTSSMVNEFPELQGIMGEYYARHDGENEGVAIAIREHYLPRYADDKLPKTTAGCVVALADRIDTLVGIFGIKQLPTGEKDPFGLRRAAAGLIRILIEKDLKNIKLNELIEAALVAYKNVNLDANVSSQLIKFILDRLPAYYGEQGISVDTVNAIQEVQMNNLADMHARIIAVNAFQQQPEAAALAEMNKRVKNILSKNQQLSNGIDQDSFKQISESILKEDAERMLYQAIKHHYQSFDTKAESELTYPQLLGALTHFKLPLDHFFNEVMVEANEPEVKNNRLMLLKTLRSFFLRVADISLLQVKS